MQISIKHRWTGDVLFICELSAEIAGKEYGLQLGFAVRKAIETDANLTRADLTDANLTRANLTDADLTRANLTDANLTRADLTPIRDDIWAVLSSAPAETMAVRDALAAGKVNGSTYEGECACLVGTIANARHCNYIALDGLRPSSWRPAERFFMAIRPGDTPETSQACKLAHGWVSEWINRMQSTFAPASN